MAEFFVTERWIEEHATGNGGWTAPQLALLGVSWPPKKGWKQRSVGRRLTEVQKAAFERLGAERRKVWLSFADNLDAQYESAMERDRR